MKKLISALLVIALFASLSACSVAPTTSNQDPQPSQRPTTQPTSEPTTTPTTAPTQPVKVQLTKENLSDYLIFSHKTEGITEVDPALNGEQYAGNLNLKTSPKKQGNFENVTLTLKFTTSATGWKTQNMTVDVPLDGKADVTKTITSQRLPSVYKVPTFGIYIDSVTGYFIPG